MHRFLGEATNCHDIVWIEGDSRDPVDVGRDNRHLGLLWVWFTNEFAHTERTWQTFVELMTRK